MRKPALRLVGRGAIALMLLCQPAIWAADPPPSSSTAQAPSKETREKMAKLHEQMAACLRSEKSMNECHTEMMKECRDAMGPEGCPMMRKGHGWMMQTPPAGTPPPK